MPGPHIVFFNRSFYPDMAATGQLLTELCEDLVRQYSCRVTVVAGVPLLSNGNGAGSGRGAGMIRREQYRGIEILRARGTTFSKQFFAGRFSNYVSYFLSSCLAGLQLSKPDVIVALTDPPIIGLAALLAARHFGVPLVLSFRDIFPEVARLLEDFQSETVNRILDRINRFLLRQTDRAIALGETMRARLVQEKGASPDKVAIIPDWADCSQITPAEKRNPFSLAHGLADVFVVMHSGNIGLSQDLHILVEAAARLQDVPDLRIVFVGDGVKRPLLQQQAQAAGLANILFLPFQPKERLTESLAAADVFIVSLKEGLAGYIVPSKLYSILAAGRPYVAAVEPACEVATITRDYGCGLLADAGNAGDLAEKIRLLYENRNLARQMGATGRKVAETHFDRKIGVRAYFDLFTGLVDAASRLQENHG